MPTRSGPKNERVDSLWSKFKLSPCCNGPVIRREIRLHVSGSKEPAPILAVLKTCSSCWDRLGDAEIKSNLMDGIALNLATKSRANWMETKDGRIVPIIESSPDLKRPDENYSD